LVRVSEEIRDTFSKARVIAMATASRHGVPNVIYVGMWWWEDNSTLCVVNNYLRKTMKNNEANPNVCFVALHREEGRSISYQVKCRAENQNKGPLYDKARRIAEERGRHFPARSVIACRVREVYQAFSGERAGNRIA